MALINCPECRKEISDKVKSCPQCGYPLVDEVIDSAHKDKTETFESNKSPKQVYKIIISIVSIITILAIVTSVVYYKKIVKPSKAFDEAVILLEKGKYDEANELFNSIPTYEDVEMLQKQLKYESRVYECIVSIKQYLKNPDSLKVYEAKFYIKDPKEFVNKVEEQAEKEPICIMRFGAQNGFGGNTTSYGLFIYSEDSGKYEYSGSCDSLDKNEIDEDDKNELIVCTMINTVIENKEEIGEVNIERIKNIIKDESYSSIKIIE